MELDFTKDEIKELVKQSKLAEPYGEYDDVPMDTLLQPLEEEEELRCQSTLATKLLKYYFDEHPEDSIENYL